MLSACAQSDTTSELFWDYTPFQSSPKISLQQAHSICNGYANNAANLAGMHSAYNNIYISCMAQNGWNAKLTRADVKMITCKNKNGEVMKIHITTDACLYNGGTVL